MKTQLTAISAISAILWVSLLMTLAPRVEAKPVPRLWDTTEMGRLMRADMATAGRDGLAQLVSTVGQRLILTTETQGIDQLGDLELLVRLGTAVQMLVEVSEPSVNLIQVERATAFAFHAVGRRYETRDDFRFAIDALESEPSGGGKLLIQAMRGMRAYGATWFRSAYERLAGQQAQHQMDAETDHQMGRIELDEGQFAKAAQRLSELFAKAPDAELARSMCEALLGVADPSIQGRVKTLMASVKDKLPALADELAACIERHADEVATKDFERRVETNEVKPGEVAPQVERYQRLDRAGAAEGLARQFMRAAPDLGTSVAAELFFKLERWETLRSLFEEARSGGRMTPRLAELEVLMRAALAVRSALGAAVTVDGNVLADLEASTLAPLVKRGERVMVLLARWLGGVGDKATTQKALDQAVADVLKNHGEEVDGLSVVLIAMVGNDRLDEGLKALKPKVDGLRKKVTRSRDGDAIAGLAAFESLLARVDLGMALRLRDGKRVTRALKAMGQVKRDALSGVQKAELAVAEVVGRLSAVVFSGAKELNVDGAQKELGALEWDLPRTTMAGRLVLQARALTLGTLGQWAGQGEVAVSRWLEARSLQSGAMAHLAGGLAQKLVGDDAGGATLCARADKGERPATAQLLSACVAAGSEGEAAKAAWSEVLALWESAKTPPVAAAMRPLFYGTFDIGVRVVNGEPFSLVLEARPIVALVPELVPERAVVEGLVR